MARSCQPQAVSLSPVRHRGQRPGACTRWVTQRSSAPWWCAASAASACRCPCRYGSGRSRAASNAASMAVVYSAVRPRLISAERRCTSASARVSGSWWWRAPVRGSPASADRPACLSCAGAASVVDAVRQAWSSARAGRASASRPLLPRRSCAPATRSGHRRQPTSMIMRDGAHEHPSEGTERTPSGAGARQSRRAARRGRGRARRASTPSCSPRTCWAWRAVGCR